MTHLELLTTELQRSGMRLTPQRVAICQLLTATDEHPTAAMIFDSLKPQFPSLSLATVYKNIHVFLDAGLLREVSPFHGTLRLEGTLEDHHHLVCTRCKTIVDLESEDLTPVQLRRSPPPGFEVLRYSVEFQGLCAACAAKVKES